MASSVNEGRPILAVVPDKAKLELLRRRLTKLRYCVASARNQAEAFRRMGETRPQVILLDATMDDDQGLALCRQIKSEAMWSDIPVLFLTAGAEPADKAECLLAGGMDFLDLSADEAELSARVAAAARVAELEDKVRHPADHDRLTGLLSRTAFEEVYHRECNRSRRYDSLFALVVVDIDRFVQVNNEYGLPFGDQVLKETAQVLLDTSRESDYVSRWGGNEFIVMLPEANLPKAIGFARKLFKAITSHDFLFDGQAVRVTVSMSVVSRQNIGGRDPGELLKIAHDCLQQAKAKGDRIFYHTCGEINQARV